MMSETILRSEYPADHVPPQIAVAPDQPKPCRSILEVVVQLHQQRASGFEDPRALWYRICRTRHMVQDAEREDEIDGMVQHRRLDQVDVAEPRRGSARDRQRIVASIHTDEAADAARDELGPAPAAAAKVHAGPVRPEVSLWEQGKIRRKV